MRQRNRRRKRLVLRCSLTPEQLREIADAVSYHGSTEHKTYPSPAGQPALRSDATPCDPDIEWAEINASLVEGVLRGCVSETMERGFPKYVWGWIGDALYEARHLNGAGGQYKGYKLEPPEYPRDREDRLSWD